MSNFAELSNPSEGDSAKFLVRWRGRQEGPYRASVIEAKLSANEISLLHEIFYDGKWVAIRDYMIERETALRDERQSYEEQERLAREQADRLVQKREEAERNAHERDEQLRAATPLRAASQNEDVFIDEGGIIVTKTRFVAGSRTFALAGITSVRGVEIDPNRLGPILLFVIGILACVFEGALMSDGPIVIALTVIFSLIAAIVWWVRQRPDFAVVLTTSGGEVTACSSSDRRFIERSINAITQAIIARG